MRFVYVNPATSNNDWETCPPLGLAYLLARVNSEAPDIVQQVIDFTVDPTAPDLFHNLVLNDPPNAVFITFMTPQAPAAFSLTHQIRARWGRCVMIIHGGCHATPRPRESLRAGADAVVLREGEDVMLELASIASAEPMRRHGLLNQVHGLAVLNTLGEAASKHSRPLNPDLDRLPFPYWDAFPLHRYSQDLHIASGLALPLLTSRGCPANCHFCSSPFMWERKMRYRSAANVVAEMKWVIDRYGIDRFHLYDDDFLVYRRHVTGIVDELRAQRLPVRFLFQARTDSVIRLGELLPQLREVGCLAIEMGVENADEAVLAGQNKRETRDQIRQAIRLVRESGIRIGSCNVMACNPGESIRGHFLQNQFLHEVLGLERIFIGNYFTLFPGSHFGDHPEKLAGRNLASGWEDYTVGDVTFVPDSLSGQRPRSTQTKLDTADMVILFPVIARAARTAGAGMTERLGLRRQIERIYAIFDGSRTLLHAAEEAAAISGVDATSSLKLATKLMIACAQVGLVSDADQPDFIPYPPPWYQRARQDAVGWYRRNRVNMFYFNDVEASDDLALLKYRPEGAQ